MPVTTILYDPVGVPADVAIVKIAEKVGEPVEGLNEHEAPAGNPLLQNRLTGWVVPLTRVTMMKLLPEPP
jgi:hypothetical protein